METDYTMKQNKNRSLIFHVLSVLVVLYSVFVMIELGDHYGRITYIFTFYYMQLKYFFLNIMIYEIMLLLLYLITGNLLKSEFVLLVVAFAYAVTNYFVVEWHGEPITFDEIANIGTALSVLGGYRFVLYKHILYITGIFTIVLGILVGVFWFQKKNVIFPCTNRRAAIAGLIISSAVLAVFWRFFAPNDPMGLNWNDSYHDYGYVVATISRAQRYDDVIKPEGYDEYDLDALIAKTDLKKETGASELPDIILILNETFYDVNRVADIHTDIPALDKFYALKDCTRGYAVVPKEGGGTNSSEFELLTGFLNYLIPGTPFNVLKMNELNSIVRLLSEVGYETVAAHPMIRENYNRGNGYPALGFGTSLFESDFIDLEEYYDRKLSPTDESVFRNLVRWYEETDNSIKPRFYYILTLQNHGGYQRNAPEYDIVHVTSDYGDYNDRLDEYLTAIKMTDDAFDKLIDYFERVERPVVVCMVGDHCPSFVKTLAKNRFTGSEYDIAVRSTPFIIWSNYLKGLGDIGTVSLNYLAPLLLQEVGIPLSVFYEYMMQMYETIPITSDIGYYIDRDGVQYNYYDNGPYKEMVNAYLFMEYNSLKDPNRKQNLFEPPAYAYRVGDPDSS